MEKSIKISSFNEVKRIWNKKTKFKYPGGIYKTHKSIMCIELSNCEPMGKNRKLYVTITTYIRLLKMLYRRFDRY